MSDPLHKEQKAALAQIKQNEIATELSFLPPFNAWPKIARLNRDIVITEKLDGTNAAIGVLQYPLGYHSSTLYDDVRHHYNVFVGTETDDNGVPLWEYQVYAQSRNHVITTKNDNYGFATWVKKNALILAETLGPGLHFGEWWGVGIARGYGLSERRFSLFNSDQWSTPDADLLLKEARKDNVAIYCVPILYQGPWLDDTHPEYDGDTYAPKLQLAYLKSTGSTAAKGYMDPEGIVIYHYASRTSFKVTIEKDELRKGLQNV